MYYTIVPTPFEDLERTTQFEIELLQMKNGYRRRVVPNVSEPFCNEFHTWANSHFDKWPNESFDAMPTNFDRVRHNAEGHRLAQEVKRLVGEEIEVEYLFLCAESERIRVRNVSRQIILLQGSQN